MALPLHAVAACIAIAGTPTLHPRIDALVAAGTDGYAKLAAPAADDAEFLRRVTLDLTGTIPTAAEARAFLADKAADKRARLIDRLLLSPAYARRMADHFDVTFMERRRGAKVQQAAWAEYLRASFADVSADGDVLVMDWAGIWVGSPVRRLGDSLARRADGQVLRGE